MQRQHNNQQWNEAVGTIAAGKFTYFDAGFIGEGFIGRREEGLRGFTVYKR